MLGEGDVAVIEADEYDRSFLKLNPDTIVLTSIDLDHLDIYRNEENLTKSFSTFVRLLSNKKRGRQAYYPSSQL